MTKISVMAAFLAALALAVGCEDAPLSAGKDYKLVLLANPSTVAIDPTDAANTATSSLIATVLSDTGVPQKGFIVFFTTDAGVLSSASQGVTTDSNGAAYDTLTVRTTDPATINVTATSSTLTGTVKITKTSLDPCAANAAPTAVILGGGSLPTGVMTAQLDGRSSTDPDGAIVKYGWDCGDGATSTGTASTFDCTYTTTVAKTYTVKLIVTDNGLGGPGPAYSCQKSSTAATATVTVTP